MSSIDDIVVKAGELVRSLSALLQDRVVQSLPDAAAQLGIEDTFNEGVRLLTRCLQSIDVELGKLGELVQQLDAVGGLLGLLEPFVAAIGRMIGGTAAELASYGLGEAVDVTEPIREGFGYAAQAIQVAQGLVVGTVEFVELRNSMFSLAQTVHRLATDVPDDAELARGEAEA